MVVGPTMPGWARQADELLNSVSTAHSVVESVIAAHQLDLLLSPGGRWWANHRAAAPLSTAPAGPLNPCRGVPG